MSQVFWFPFLNQPVFYGENHERQKDSSKIAFYCRTVPPRVPPLALPAGALPRSEHGPCPASSPSFTWMPAFRGPHLILCLAMALPWGQEIQVLPLRCHCLGHLLAGPQPLCAQGTVPPAWLPTQGFAVPRELLHPVHLRSLAVGAGTVLLQIKEKRHIGGGGRGEIQATRASLPQSQEHSTLL